MAKITKLPARDRQWAAYAAIDWADRKNSWIVLAAGSDTPQQGEIENTPEAVDNWATELHHRFQGRPVAVCLEQKRGPLVYMLTKYSHLVLMIAHPTTAAAYRETFAPSGAKDDDSDTISLLDLLLRHPDRLRQLDPDTDETRLLQFLTEDRRRLVDMKTAECQRLRARLKLYFPQILQWFDDLSSHVVGDLLKRWPTLEELQRVNPAKLGKFFTEHNCRSQEKIQERTQQIYAALPATKDQAVIRAASAAVRAQVELIGTLRSQIQELEQQIRKLEAEHPDSRIFRSFPGSGDALTPRLIAAFGTRRDRYKDAAELQTYSGIAPITRASGQNEKAHFRWAAPKFLRQTFHEFAACSIAKSKWAQAYYNYQREEKKKDRHAALRALAYKWMRILFRCWKDGTLYDERVHLLALQRRAAPLAATGTDNTKAQWTQTAGFHKLSAK
jgi:transposase